MILVGPSCGLHEQSNSMLWNEAVRLAGGRFGRSKRLRFLHVEDFDWNFVGIQTSRLESRDILETLLAFNRS
jgi:hypothetical protein